MTDGADHAYETSHSLPPRAAMLEGGMMVYRALTRGDTLSAIHIAQAFRDIADWLVDSTRERLTADDAERALVKAVNKILGERR